MTRMAAIFIRAPVGIRKEIRDTLTYLNMRKKNVCVVIPATPNYLGMLQKAKDFITYGEIDDEIYLLLNEKRKSKHENVFFLHPPRGGFEKRGIKFAYHQKGALGQRDNMNDLIRRML
ncbi:MAG: uL30 family ribosomal protein [Nanoarchaeota archaeon]